MTVDRGGLGTPKALNRPNQHGTLNCAVVQTIVLQTGGLDHGFPYYPLYTPPLGSPLIKVIYGYLSLIEVN